MDFRRLNRQTVSMAVVLLFVLSAGRESCGQELGQEAPTRVTLGIHSHYQFFSADAYTLSQFSTPFFVNAAVTREVGLTIRAAQAYSSSDVMASVSGFSDVQLGLVYSPRLVGHALTAGINLNMPVGRDELTEEEFATSLFMNRQFYGFRMPGLGQGFNVSPSLSWASSITRDVALGVGAAYQYKGSFEPLTGMDAAFNPGDEVLLTVGLDVRTGPAGAISADFTFTLFEDDKIGDEVVFEAGHNIHAILRYKQFIQFDHIQIAGVYRSRGRSDAPAAGGLPLEGRTVPNSAELSVSYGWRINPQITFGFFGLARVFERIELFPDERQYFAVGIAPDFAITNNVRGVTRLSYGVGTASGGEVGLGIVAGF